MAKIGIKNMPSCSHGFLDYYDITVIVFGFGNSLFPTLFLSPLLLHVTIIWNILFFEMRPILSLAREWHSPRLFRIRGWRILRESFFVEVGLNRKSERKGGNILGTPNGSPVKVRTFYHDVVWVTAARLETSFGGWIARMRLAVPVLYHRQKSFDTLLLKVLALFVMPS